MVVTICNCSHKNLIILSLIITSIIFIFLDQKVFYNFNQIFDNSLEITIPDKTEIYIENKIEDKNIFNQWKLEIPKINLSANIQEGTSMQVMNKNIGHFVETSKENGNIGLAAHNRGYKVNYFKNLKKLKKGDLVIYTYKGKSKNYIVNSSEIIKDTDWSKLNKSSVDKLTMITCVEDKPNYRLCVQAILKEN